MAIELLTYSNLEEYKKAIIHFSSTRGGGVSKGEYGSLNLGNFSDDSYGNIVKNRQLLCDTLHISYAQLTGAHQVHGKEIKLVDETLARMDSQTRDAALEGYDALICQTPEICITVTTADCVPVLLFDPETRSIGAIHSGWRSTLQNIVACTIRAMQHHFSALPENIIAAIGPCISGEVYEVGAELKEQFDVKGFASDRFFKAKENGKFLFDIRQVVKSQLEENGVNNIELSPLCTFLETELFFSARRQGIHSGRMLSGIMLTN